MSSVYQGLDTKAGQCRRIHTIYSSRKSTIQGSDSFNTIFPKCGIGCGKHEFKLWVLSATRTVIGSHPHPEICRGCLARLRNLKKGDVTQLIPRSSVHKYDGFLNIILSMPPSLNKAKRGKLKLGIRYGGIRLGSMVIYIPGRSGYWNE